MLAQTSSTTAATKIKSRAFIALDNYEYAGRDLKKGDRFTIEDEEHAKLLLLMGRAKNAEPEASSPEPSPAAAAPLSAALNDAASAIAAAAIAPTAKHTQGGSKQRNKNRNR